MGGLLLLGAFEVCGGVAAMSLARRRGLQVRLWLGLALGLMMMMWLPALFSFFWGGFNIASHICALISAALIAAGCWTVSRRYRPAEPKKGEIPLRLLLALVVPLLIISIYIMSTHTIRESEGALYVGQSTYGDLCLHLGIATGLTGGDFPPTYTLIQGVELGYPFLSDSLAASMLIFGTGLRTAFLYSGCLMLALVYWGYAVFAWEITGSRMAVAVGFALMFLNGGLGFLYVFDGAASDSTMLKEVFTGYYHAPANMPALNLRWVNVLCDMLVPQRTLLAGWTVLMPALFGLVCALRSRRMSRFLALGVWAGLMPMVHTHSFLALGLISGGAMISALARAGEKRREVLRGFLAYGLLACALALPQLVRWTFPQTLGGGSLAVRFNWVNNNGNGTFRDGYFWFWIKNVGIVYVLLVPAALNMKRTGRALALGALAVYAMAEIFQFQPNPYDNNKLFYAAFIVMTPMVGALVRKLWSATRGLNCRVMFLVIFMVVSTLSGALSIGREMISSYRLFAPEENAAAEFVKSDTPRDAVFLTGNQHNNPITALAGRQIVCGTGSYLYYHGIDHARQAADEAAMLCAPAQNAELFEKYGVDYVYISAYERGTFDVDEDYFETNCLKVFESGSVSIYKFTNPLYTEDDV